MSELETCGAAFRPSRLYLGALAVGAAIDYAAGWRLDAVTGLGTSLDVLAYGSLGMGLTIFGWAMARFRTAGTPVPTIEPSSALVSNGPYRISRNPIYLGVTLLYIGLAMSFNGVAAFLFLPGVLAAMHYGVILREEAYLSKLFGADYREYRGHTSRWLGVKRCFREALA